jgi:P27 family predicted phage terminase small subunit
MGLRGPLPRSATTATTTAAPSAPLAAPPWLPEPAGRVWAEVEPALRAAGRLRPEHSDTLANYCCTASELRSLSSIIAASGSTYEGPHGRCPSAEHSAAARLRTTLLSLAKALGLTPDSAARLDAGRGPGDDPADEVAAYARSRTKPRADDEAAPLPPVREGHQQTVLDYLRRNRDAG